MSTRTRSSRKAQERVLPSSIDGIDRWLDVLTSMLNLPNHERTQVRDELEDHLRSRVDDLLITGVSEPDAIRKAVEELGETAELAVLISNAHTQSRTRRHIMHFTLAATAIAGMTFGGISLLNPQTQTTPPPEQTVLMNEGAVPVDLTSERPIEFVGVPFLVGFQNIAEAFDLDIKLDSLEPTQVRELQGRDVSLSGSYGLSHALQSLFVQSLSHAADLNYIVEDGTLELLTHDELERRSVTTEVFRLDHGDSRRARTVLELLRSKIDSPWLRVEIVGDSLVIAAPESDFEHVKPVLKLVEKEFRDAQRARDRAAYEMEAAQRNDLEQLKSEYDTLRESYFAKVQELTQRQHRYERFMNGGSNIDIDQLGPDEILKLIETEEFLVTKCEFEAEEIKRRLDKLQTILIEREYGVGDKTSE